MLFDKLYQYQKEAVDFSIDVLTSALFFEQGTGKTWITAGIIERLMSQISSFEGLVVVPLTNIETTWQKIFNDHLPNLYVCRDWKSFKASPSPKILLIHYEGLTRLIKQLLRRKTWSYIVFDESQRLKAKGTRQSRQAKRLRNKAPYKTILSGTPIEQAPQDLWAQFRFLNPKVFGECWDDFDTHYLKPSGYMGYERTFRQALMPEFLRRIEPYSMRVKKDEVLELPKLTTVRVPVELFGTQRESYEAMEDDLFLSLGHSTVTADLKVTQIVKLQQICSGFVIDDDGLTQTIGAAKLRKLKALIKPMPGPVVIFCKYLEEIHQIHAAISPMFGRVELFYGKVKRSERAGILSDFQNGLIDVLICQVRTGGIGIDLYRSSCAIIYSMTFSYIDFAQLISRLHRHGQKELVRIFLIYVKNSIDEDIYNAILSKHSVSEAILTRLKKRRTTNGQRKSESYPQKGHRTARRPQARNQKGRPQGIR